MPLIETLTGLPFVCTGVQLTTANVGEDSNTQFPGSVHDKTMLLPDVATLITGLAGGVSGPNIVWTWLWTWLALSAAE